MTAGVEFEMVFSSYRALRPKAFSPTLNARSPLRNIPHHQISLRSSFGLAATFFFHMLKSGSISRPKGWMASRFTITTQTSKTKASFCAGFEMRSLIPPGCEILERAIREYPREFFAVTQDYPADILAKWDKDLALRPLTGVSANDCHHNQGFIVTCASSDAIEVKERVDPGKPHRVTVKEKPEIEELLRGRASGDVIANLDFDPYERSLLYVSTHILSKALDERSVRDALRKGRAFVAHDWIFDSTGFQFLAERNGKVVATMGEPVKASGDLMLRADLPARARIRVLHNGRLIHQIDGVNLRFPVSANGVYRLEAWVELDGELRPWIYSNPIRGSVVSDQGSGVSGQFEFKL